jgi:nucleoside-diphosphate-sugar epimerase
VRILLTGASSFTGFWFVRALAGAGHDVTAVFQRPAGGYGDEPRRARVALVGSSCRAIHGVAFGDERFLRLVEEGGWDLLAHHGAHVTDYRSPAFDAMAAAQANTRGVRQVLEALAARGCRRVLLTGSVFEGGEGAGSQGLPHFSPYALSKALTAEVFRYYAERAGVGLGKFVIPNPFGPYEEARYTAYLVKTWKERKVARCASPAYVRDNVHVSLLARAYVQFAAALPGAGFVKTNPSGYAESQGAFTRRFAEALRPRLGLPCEVELARQTEFPEPRVRINTDLLDPVALGWDEEAAWDAVAEYYRDA